MFQYSTVQDSTSPVSGSWSFDRYDGTSVVLSSQHNDTNPQGVICLRSCLHRYVSVGPSYLCGASLDENTLVVHSVFQRHFDMDAMPIPRLRRMEDTTTPRMSRLPDWPRL